MQKSIKLLFLIFSILLVSCGKIVNIEINNMPQVEYALEFPSGNIYKLAGVCENQICRFIIFDSLGMPIINKEYMNNKFKSVKFLPPNNKYDELFKYIISTSGNIDKFSFKIDNQNINIYKE